MDHYGFYTIGNLAGTQTPYMLAWNPSGKAPHITSAPPYSCCRAGSSAMTIRPSNISVCTFCSPMPGNIVLPLFGFQAHFTRPPFLILSHYPRSHWVDSHPRSAYRCFTTPISSAVGSRPPPRRSLSMLGLGIAQHVLGGFIPTIPPQWTRRRDQGVPPAPTGSAFGFRLQDERPARASTHLMGVSPLCIRLYSLHSSLPENEEQQSQLPKTQNTEVLVGRELAAGTQSEDTIPAGCYRP